MKLKAVPGDRLIYVDGKALMIDPFPNVNGNWRAIHWDDGVGWAECYVGHPVRVTVDDVRPLFAAWVAESQRIGQMPVDPEPDADGSGARAAALEEVVALQARWAALTRERAQNPARGDLLGRLIKAAEDRIAELRYRY